MSRKIRKSNNVWLVEVKINPRCRAHYFTSTFGDTQHDAMTQFMRTNLAHGKSWEEMKRDYGAQIVCINLDKGFIRIGKGY